MFPFSIKGEFELAKENTIATDHLLDKIEQELEIVRAKQISRLDNMIVFQAGIFRPVSNLNVLAAVGKGSIEVIPSLPIKIRYYFSCVQMLVTSIILASVFGLMESSFLQACVIGFFVFGLNYLISTIRLPLFVRQAADVSRSNT